MGRPTKCLPNRNPFLFYSKPIEVTTTTSTTSTIPPEDLSSYINIPISGANCPTLTTTTTTATSTTLSPLIISNDLYDCNKYDISIFELELLVGPCDPANEINKKSSIVTYQPCGSGILVNQILYDNKSLCVVKDNIRLISTNMSATLAQNSFCGVPCPCDLIIKEVVCDLVIKDISCDLQIALI